jgi:hypothetical protein
MRLISLPLFALILAASQAYAAPPLLTHELIPFGRGGKGGDIVWQAMKIDRKQGKVFWCQVRLQGNITLTGGCSAYSPAGMPTDVADSQIARTPLEKGNDEAPLHAVELWFVNQTTGVATFCNSAKCITLK